MERESNNTNKEKEFLEYIKNLKTEDSILIGTNQMMSGNLDEYPTLKNIVSINFGSCIGFFAYSGKNFLFIHSDRDRLNSAIEIIDNFRICHNPKNFTNLFYFYNCNYKNIEKEKYDNDKNNISLDLKSEAENELLSKLSNINFVNKKCIEVQSFDKLSPVFDLFLNVLPIKNNEDLSYYHLGFDGSIVKDPYMVLPDNGLLAYKKAKDLLQFETKNNETFNAKFYLNNELIKDNLIQENYLSSFVYDSLDKSPGRIVKSLEATYYSSRKIKDIQNYIKDSGEDSFFKYKRDVKRLEYFLSDDDQKILNNDQYKDHWNKSREVFYKEKLGNSDQNIKQKKITEDFKIVPEKILKSKSKSNPLFKKNYDDRNIEN